MSETWDHRIPNQHVRCIDNPSRTGMTTGVVTTTGGFTIRIPKDHPASDQSRYSRDPASAPPGIGSGNRGGMGQDLAVRPQNRTIKYDSISFTLILRMRQI
jgi:hypothetical protein